MKNIFKKILQSVAIISLLATIFSPGIAFADRSWSPPDQTGHAGQFLQTDGTNTLWANASGSGISLKTNGVSNSDQTILDLLSGTGISLVAGSSGHVTINATGTATIGGSIAKFQVGFGSGTNTLSGSSDFLFKNNELTSGLAGNLWLDVNPNANTASIGDISRAGHATTINADDKTSDKVVYTQSDNGFQVQDTNGVIAFNVNPATSLIDAVSKKIQNVLDPTNPQDAVTKAYADALANGLQWKQTVDVATFVDLPSPYVYANGTLGVGATITSTDPGFAPLGNIDGYAITVNQRILVKNQADPKQNGIYIFTRDGNGASIEWQLTRSGDDNTQALMKFAAVGVVNNGSQAQTGWTQTNNPGPGPVIGTDNITWVQFLNTVYLPGAGLGLSAHTFFLDTTHPNEWQGTGIQTFDSGLLKLKGSISGLVTISAADTTVPYPIKLPPSQGVNRTYLQEDGAGNLAWATAVFNLATGVGLTGGPITGSGAVSLDSKLSPADSLTGNSLKVLRVNAGETAVEYATAGVGTVTSVASGTGLTGGPITGSGTLSIANTAVTAGSYTNANITVNAQGQLTAASSGSGGGSGTVTSITPGLGLSDSSDCSTNVAITTSGTLYNCLLSGKAGGQTAVGGRSAGDTFTLEGSSAASTGNTTNPAFTFTNSTLNGSSTAQIFASLTPTINQTSTAGYTALKVNATETSVGSGAKNLLDLQIGGTSKFAVSGSSLTGSAATSLLNMSQTWNTSGNPTALLLNITNTASAATSKLLDLQQSGTSKFNVNALGNAVLAGSSQGGALANTLLSLTDTWNTSGSPTALKLNVTNTTSGASSLLADLQANGTSMFKVDKAGNGTFNTSIATTVLWQPGAGTPLYMMNGNQSGTQLVTSTGDQGIVMFADGAGPTNLRQFTQTSGTNHYLAIYPHYNQASGTAANTDIFLNRIVTAVGGGVQNLMDLQVGSVSKFSVSATGQVTTPAWLVTSAGLVQEQGDLQLSLGKALDIKSGANSSAGTSTLSSGTVTVSTTAVKTGDIIYLTYNTPSGTLASGLSAPTASISTGASFVINSLTTAGTVNTLDNSTVNWVIVHTH